MANTSHGGPRILGALAEKALFLGLQEKVRSLDAAFIHAAYEATMIYERQGKT